MKIKRCDELVSWTEVQDIDLVVGRRMREYMTGPHRSVFHGEGLDFVGLRDWQPGDRASSIDWSQSTLTNFSPLITREYEQQSTARVVVVADTSLSTRCGVGGMPVATAIARAVATLAFAGAYLQDQVGLITFDGRSRQISVRPGVGKNHALHCVDAYQDVVLGRAEQTLNGTDAMFAGMLRKTSMVPVVSDFLFEDYMQVLDELLELKAMHDVFVFLIDSCPAFDLPSISAGWVKGYDVETGQSRLFSSSEIQQMGTRVGIWQEMVEVAAAERGLEVLRLGADPERFHQQVVEFLAERRLRKQ